jgi:hypothetical protein
MSAQNESVLIPTYEPRFFGRLSTWRFSNWAIKVYGISTQAPDQKLVLDSGLVDEAHSYVEANLARMNAAAHYSVGFVILHHGSGENAFDSMVGKRMRLPAARCSIRIFGPT